MKTNAKFLCELVLGVSLGLAAMAQCAQAADFNPQPDPPGKSANNTRLHNPPGDKGALIDPNDKVKKGVLIDANEKTVKGAVIAPNEKIQKGLVIDPTVKKN